MLTTTRSGFSSTAVAIAILAGAAFDAAPAAADNARWGAGYFPAVTLTTQDAAEVRFYDDLVKGKIVAINLIYTSCKYACPLETARLTQVAKLLGDRMGRDIFFYSISIDPEHDTPAVLKAYAEKYQAGPGWLFLTGKKSEIDTISRKLGLYSEPDPSNPDGHTPMLLIGNEETGQWMRISAMDNPKFMSRTIGDWLNSWQTAKKPAKSYADVPEFKFDEGEYKFRNHCAACHTIGRGDRLGPDLAGVTTRRDRDWLSRFIVDPEEVRAAKDPAALALRAKYQQVVMPSLDLGKRDAALLIDYIDRRSAEIKRSQEIRSGARDAIAPHHKRNCPTTVQFLGRSGGSQLSSDRDVPRAGAETPDVESLTRLVHAYLRVQRALHADGFAALASDARAIAVEAARLGAGGGPIRASAAELEKATTLAAARAAFGGVGDAIMRYAKESGARLEVDVKVAYCPMANKRWLQKGDVVQNPFYGKAMSDCGRIVTDVAEGEK